MPSAARERGKANGWEMWRGGFGGREDEQTRVQSYEATGKLATRWTGLPGYVDTWSPAIAAGGGGLQVAVWSDGDEVAKVRDIYAAYSHDAGLSWSAPQPISTTTGASVEPDVLIAGEQVGQTQWPQRVELQRLDHPGVP